MTTATPAVLVERNGWRLVEKKPGSRPTREVQVQQPDGTWFWPDCQYSCELCGICLGCARNTVHHDMQAWLESGEGPEELEIIMDCASVYGGRCEASSDGKHVVRD